MPVGFDIMHLQTLCACHLQLGDQAEADFHKTTGGATATGKVESWQPQQACHFRGGVHKED